MNLKRGPATAAPRGSLHLFRSGQILNPYTTRYRSPFACSAFSYPLPQQFPSRVTCHRFSILKLWRRIGLTVFRIKDTSRLGSTYSPAIRCPCSPSMEGAIRLHAFWLKPYSIFGLLHLTTFIGDSLSLTVLLTLAPYPSDADRKHLSLTGSMPHSRAGYVVPAASHHLVTEIACAGRVRLTEQPVSSLAQAS
jgi:hypothetical protein